MNRTFVMLAIGALAAGGCDMLTGPEPASQVVGIIALEPAPSAPAVDHAAFEPLAAPDTVLVGVPFTVTITTVGLSPCWRQDGVVLGAATNALMITPLDRIPTTEGGAQRPCPGEPVKLPRTVQLVISRPGPITLAVRGRRVVGGDLATAATIVLETSIVAR